MDFAQLQMKFGADTKWEPRYQCSWCSKPLQNQNEKNYIEKGNCCSTCNTKYAQIAFTQHYREKKQLSILNIGKNRNSSDKRYILTSDKDRWLNNGLTDVKLEEYRREENNRKVFDLEKDTEQERLATLQKLKEIKGNLFADK